MSSSWLLLLALASCGRIGFDAVGGGTGDGGGTGGGDASLGTYRMAYVKASNAEAQDQFGFSVAVSRDGSTVAVGAPYESSNATTINGNQANNSTTRGGAVYVFVRSGATWIQQAYIKPTTIDPNDFFGSAVALSGDGNTLAVSSLEDSAATTINGNQASNAAVDSGAVFVFVRSGTVWSQQAYVKASNAEAGDLFGAPLALSGNGDLLAVSATSEDSASTGIGGNQASNAALDSGAVYVFSRAGTTWSQQAYVKASNTDAGDQFGYGLALSADGATLLVGAPGEASGATTIDGNQADNAVASAGAAYAFVRSGTMWSQQAYLKPSTIMSRDDFGIAVALSDDGNLAVIGSLDEQRVPAIAGAAHTLTRAGTTWSQGQRLTASNAGSGDAFGTGVAVAGNQTLILVGAPNEDSAAEGANGDQADNSSRDSGARYFFAGSPWTQVLYEKPTVLATDDGWASRVGLSSDGLTRVSGAPGEDGGTTGVDGDPSDNSATDSGAISIGYYE